MSCIPTAYQRIRKLQFAIRYPVYRLPRKEFIFRWERAQGQYARFISYEASILSLRSLTPEYKFFCEVLYGVLCPIYEFSYIDIINSEIRLFHSTCIIYICILYNAIPWDIQIECTTYTCGLNQVKGLQAEF